MAKKKPSAKQSRKRLDEFLKPFRITKGKGFRLSQIDPGDSRGVKSKEEATEYLQQGISRLAAAQDKLYAQDHWAVLLVFQAMDAAGKDGAIKHVMSGVNPQGCQVFRSRRPRARSWTTTSCGAPARRCPSAAASGSSTAPTTRRCWW